MVSYQKWTSIAFEVAKQKGMENSQENSQALVSLVAKLWRENKEALSTATIAEARATAEAEITIS